jgi:hypothetical protein
VYDQTQGSSVLGFRVSSVLGFLCCSYFTDNSNVGQFSFSQSNLDFLKTKSFSLKFPYNSTGLDFIFLKNCFFTPFIFLK